MSATLEILDVLESKRAETFAALIDKHDHRVAFDEKTSWLKGQLQSLYRMAIESSKGDLTVGEVFDLWDKMVSICDFFIDYMRITTESSSSAGSYDEFLDLRLACDDKREFHRCSQ